MHKNFKKSFENERKIERSSFVTERDRERKTAKKLTASGAQNFRLSLRAEHERKQLFERTKTLVFSHVEYLLSL